MLHLIDNAKHCGARSETPQVSRHAALVRLNQIMLGYAAARTAGYCIRVFRLANSDSGTRFATLAALSAAFS